MPRLPARIVLLASLLTLGVAQAAPAPYSLPWQLRPTAAANVVRLDNAIAFNTLPDGSSQTTVPTLLLASYKLTPNFAPLVRWGAVYRTGGAVDGAVAWTNPVIGGTWALPLSDELRLGLFLGLTVPIGSGGGNTPDPEAAAAIRSGVLARSSMDNAMFAVNDFTVFPGVGLSWVSNGFTAQVEATVLQLTRVRGEEAQADASRTNFTSGVHLGYFFVPELSVGAELRYQRWLSTPVAVADNAALRDTLTAAAGVRGHFKLGEKTWFRPGIAYARGLDDPMSAQDYSVLQVDLVLAY
jgi:hypothetical protein